MAQGQMLGQFLLSPGERQAVASPFYVSGVCVTFKSSTTMSGVKAAIWEPETAWLGSSLAMCLLRKHLNSQRLHFPTH